MYRCALMRGGVVPFIQTFLAKQFDVKEESGEESGEDSDDEDNAETAGVQLVTGVALLTGLCDAEMEKLEKAHDKKITTLDSVASWSSQQLVEADISKLRESPRTAPSLPQGVAPLPSFVCPISMDLMCDPVLTADAMTFERVHIVKWLKKVSFCACLVMCGHSRRSAADFWFTPRH